MHHLDVTRKHPLGIGFLLQYEAGDMTNVYGPVLHIRAVIDGFKQRGHRVRMVTLRNSMPAWSDDLVHWQLSRLGVCQSRPFRAFESVLRGVQSRLRLPFLRLFDSYRFSDACTSALAGYDVLYERNWLLNYGGLIAAKRLGIPLVFEVNGDLIKEYAELGIQLSRCQWVAINIITRLMFQQVDHVVAVSEPLKQSAVRRWGIDPSKVSVVENGTHVSLFGPAHDFEPIRLKYGLDHQPLVMFVGTFQPWHGIDLLLESFREVLDCQANVRLVLVGDGPLRVEMQARASKLGLSERVVFTGIVPYEDVPGLLSIAQVVVLNPRVSAASASGSPLKLFEYMASGKAIVAPISPNVERVLTHGVNAFLVPPNDPQSLTDALLALLRNDELRVALGEVARRQAVERHSWDRAVAELEGIISSLTNRGSRAKGTYIGRA